MGSLILTNEWVSITGIRLGSDGKAEAVVTERQINIGRIGRPTTPCENSDSIAIPFKLMSARLHAPKNSASPNQS
jgi:hypothetical protein